MMCSFCFQKYLYHYSPFQRKCQEKAQNSANMINESEILDRGRTIWYNQKKPRSDLMVDDEADDMNAWFEKVKAIADSLGYASDMKAYKANPDAFKGNVADISMFIRLAVTGKTNAPDLYTVMQIMGKDRVFKRIENMIASI